MSGAVPVRWAVAEVVPPLLEFLLRMQLFLRAIAVCARLHLAEVISPALCDVLAEVPDLLLESSVQLM